MLSPQPRKAPPRAGQARVSATDNATASKTSARLSRRGLRETRSNSPFIIILLPILSRVVSVAGGLTRGTVRPHGRPQASDSLQPTVVRPAAVAGRGQGRSMFQATR